MLATAAAAGAADVARFTHGTTVATNALLERRGARTAFVATAGFEHLLHLRRQNRAHLYRLCAEHPPPLVPLESCFGVRERAGPSGVLEPLDLASLPDLGDAEAAAICLLHSYRHPEHEQTVAAELRRRHPELYVVASHESAPEFREYERASTTAADAYLTPTLRRYLLALAEDCVGAGLPEPLVMRSSGGLAALASAAEHAAAALLSGPAAGVIGAALVAGAAGAATHSRSTWAAPRPTSAQSSAAHRPARPSARWPGCRSACLRSTSTPSAPAAARSSGATRAARSGSGRGARPPTPAPPATAAAASSRP